MTTFVILRLPVTTLVADFTNPDHVAKDLLILNSLLVYRGKGQLYNPRHKYEK